MIAIVDYGVGNIKAISNIYENLGINAFIVQTPSELRRATKIILPGVGSFDKAITLLKSKLFFDEILNFSANKNNKILGICVGMQILASTSDEGELSGFSFIDNNFDKLKSKLIPHIGWNNVSVKKNHYLFKDIKDNSLFYFLHSYCLSEFQKEYIVAETNYEQNFISVFEKKNITCIFVVAR